MIHHLNIQDFLEQSQGHLTLDVRSEGEYEYGHILHAVSLPLFNNEERKIIGTAYKQQGKNEAVLQGLDHVGKKMSEFVRFVQPKVSDNKIFVHCWRGGMRSGSMAWLLNLFGYEVHVLSGGYKSYRHYVLECIAQKYRLIIIGGKTGSGKTDVLLKLKEMGEQVIDLEALANHKGSAFGALGLPAQPSTEHFENMLAEAVKDFDLDKRVWVEDESKSVGRVFIDKNLWQNMRSSPVFVIELPLEVRLQRLVRDYGCQPMDGLEEAITNIKRRLGNEQWKEAIDAVRAKDFAGAARITLYYYDKAYDKGLSMRETKEIFRFTFEAGDLKNIAATLICAAEEKKL